MFKATLDGDKVVAIKFVMADSSYDARSMTRFAREIKICHSCRNEYVVGFVGAFLQKVVQTRPCVTAKHLHSSSKSNGIAPFDLPCCRSKQCPTCHAMPFIT